ncbi:S8 family serine peptidase [Nocardioides euryhalodurans]|uniref:S8 family serine peptidase n=1 Tax=Nocardioides euryhalodurans TaxID=2518370 RepID=UPI001420F953|nr:S8 family serine peptidase [Nocardioides euryhalodurans]
MIRRTVVLSVVAVLTLGTVPAAVASPGGTSDSVPSTVEPVAVSPAAEPEPVLSLGDGPGRELYIVQLEGDAVPSYTGGVKGLAPVQTQGRSFSPEAAREEAYRDHLVDEQADVRRDIADVTGRTTTVTFSYTDALNGFALPLTREEAREVAGLDGVVAVQVQQERQPQTDVGPEWIGAPGIWDGTATPSGAGTKGEGVVIGVLDTGINAANPAFAATVPGAAGGDDYVVQNPRGRFYGACDPTSAVYRPGWGCTDKLIGAWDFAPGDDTGSNGVGYGYDDTGHGTHTASTAAGNQVRATVSMAGAGTTPETVERVVKGVAPHANVIAYDVCSGGCPEAAIVAGIDQAIADGVDVINYSIGGDTPSAAWTDPDATGLLNARAAGIHVAASAGNGGPGPGTMGSPGDVPWLTSVASTSHNRAWRAEVEQITADGGATRPDIDGLSFSGATDGAFPLVDAGDIGSNRCLAEALVGVDLTGTIVVCETGITGRTVKGSVVKALGAEGMILMNGSNLGSSLNADAHALPAVHITHADGLALEMWMDAVAGERASISAGEEHLGADVADVLAASSGRGPNRAVDIVSPSLSAPGVDVLAGDGTANQVRWGFRSGTSMASPHVAGSLALLAASHPDWTPAEAQSALMTTASTGVRNADGSAADWFGMGSGRVDLTRAADAGLVLDETEGDYLGANPAGGGDVTELNLASMADSDCRGTCTWTRTVTATETGAGSWTAQGTGATDGIKVTITPASFTLAPGATQQLTITADVAGAPTDDHLLGTVTLTPGAGSAAPAAHLPVAARPATGFWAGGSVAIRTRRDTGSHVSAPIAAAAAGVQVEASRLVPASTQALTIPQDTTNSNPYDANGRQVIAVPVAAGATRLVAEVAATTAQDVDLYVGTGPTPSAATEVASSVSSGAAERIDLPLGASDAGPWWILVQNRTASAPGGATGSTSSTPWSRARPGTSAPSARPPTRSGPRGTSGRSVPAGRGTARWPSAPGRRADLSAWSP